MGEKVEFEKLREILSEMHQFDENRDYYAFTFTADETGRLNFSTQTAWNGWANDKLVNEIRIPSLVKPDKMAKGWELMRQPYLVVNRDEHYFVFCILGGNALIAADIVQKIDPQLLAPSICAQSGASGFIGIKNLPKQAFNHAPTPKQRIRIFKRDGFRCRICGRKPADYTDVELHIHHIRPFGDGGLTEDGNLITLCHTCHKGLEPHGDSSMFFAMNSIEAESANFSNNVRQYRDVLWKEYSKVSKT